MIGLGQDAGFAVWINGRRVTGGPVLDERRAAEGGRRQVDVVHAVPGAEITHHTVRYDGTGLLECWQVVRATEPIRIDRVDSLVATVEGSDLQILEWSGSWGEEFEPIRSTLSSRHVVETVSGRSSHGRHPFVVLTDADGTAVAVSVRWSGNWQVIAEPEGPGHRIEAGLHERDFQVELQPGETFESPRVALATGTDLNDIGVQFTRVGRRHWYPHAAALPNEWNHWWTYEDSRIDEATFLHNAEAAVRIGLQASTLDAGWFGPSDGGSHWVDYRGDWHLVNGARFPRGIAPLARDVVGLGLRFGIWCEIEAVGTKAALRSEHPEFLAGRAGTDLGYVCFGNPDACEWAVSTLERLIAAGAGWIKLDFNLDPGSGCDRTDHGHGAGDGLYRHYRNYYAVLDRIKQNHPQVILENCSSGGLRIDTEMLRHTDATFLSDADWPEHGLTIVWGASLMLPPERLLHWGFSEWGPTEHRCQNFDPRDPELTPQRLAFYRRIAMLGSTGCSIGLTDLPEWVERELAGHNRFYAEVMARFVGAGELRRLTGQPGRFGGGERWAAFQYSLGEEHLIPVFRIDGEPERTVRALALEPDRAYTVHALDARTTVQRTGAELMSDGIRLVLEPGSSEIFRVAGA